MENDFYNLRCVLLFPKSEGFFNFRVWNCFMQEFSHFLQSAVVIFVKIFGQSAYYALRDSSVRFLLTFYFQIPPEIFSFVPFLSFAHLSDFEGETTLSEWHH